MDMISATQTSKIEYFFSINDEVHNIKMLLIILLQKSTLLLFILRLKIWLINFEIMKNIPFKHTRIYYFVL